ncbi:hypothetical protein [Treponema sp.]|uniref:hypothetical protein n=1 Tax=Treponema sp. TaxID=166 RepID=UPI003FD6EA23
MIQQSPYLPKQMNGPVVNAVLAAMDERLKNADIIEDYLYKMSILTAQETELESIGCIIGYPRPLVPVGFSQENVLILSELPQYQDIQNGLAAVGSEVGGRFSSTKKTASDYMELGLYRNFLDKVAYIKRYGITLYAVDQIARLMDSQYTIGWDSNRDITVDFKRNIGFKNVWILTQLFYQLATSPQVIITAGTN